MGGGEGYPYVRSSIDPATYVFPHSFDSQFHGVMSQSTRAHRLCQKAYRIGGQELQVPAICALFKAYLEDGQDIADNNVLADIAQNVGMMPKNEVNLIFQMILSHFDPMFNQALRFLESDELEKEVDDMCTAARSKGITGVPITIIDGKWAVTGGQSADVYIQVNKCLTTMFDRLINVADLQETRCRRYLCSSVPHAFRSSGDWNLYMTSFGAFRSIVC
jgi:hypothetical protein